MGSLVFKEEDEGAAPPQVLTSRLEIAAILRPLQASQAPLDIIFPEAGSSCFRTFLVELALDEGYLALDELVPKYGNRLLEKTEAFRVESFYEGIQVVWQNHEPVIRDARTAYPCYWARLPSRLTYHQRRRFYRAALISRTDARISDTREDLYLEGKLLDISAGGCKMQIEGQAPAGLKRYKVYQNLIAQLRPGPLEVAVELKHAHYDEARNSTTLGLRFHLNNSGIQRKIESFVNELQREQRLQRP